MKFFKSVVFLSHALAGQAMNDKYKQTGARIDRDKRIKKPTRQHGNAIVRVFEDGDAIFKLRSKDNARVVMVSDNEDIDYSIRGPGRNSHYETLDRLMEGGRNPGARGKEKINGREVDARAIKLRIEEGGELRVKAEVGGRGRGKGRGKGREDRGNWPRSLAESKAVAILNPGSDLNVCYETASLTNYVGEPLGIKISLCETATGAVHGDGGEGILQGQAVIDIADVGGDESKVPIPESGEDGFSTLAFTPNAAGLYSIVVDVDVSADEETFERQVHGVIAVSEKQLDSVESVSLGMEGDSATLAVKVALADGYSPGEGDEGDSFIVYADIVDRAGKDIVTASAIADLEPDGTLRVIIQPEWFEGTESSDCLVEYLRISNADGSVPLVIAEDVAVETTSNIFVRNRRLSEKPEDRELRMTQGVRPPQEEVADRGNLRRQLKSSTVIATHGYCSSSVWEPHLPGNVKFFADYDASRSHSYFAYLLDAYADSQGYSYESGNSCGIIAHSQGGAAALHMYTYRWSCLDNITTGRRIQSVGTPYQGTSLAGSLADLGNVFGVGCGTNYDLTYGGAEAWLSGIPSWSRNNVFYHTTSFTDRWWSYDYCQFATDLLLSDPDDGVTERWSGQLSGGNNMGHKTGWCHTSGMSEPAQVSDPSRNNNMLAYASS